MNRIAVLMSTYNGEKYLEKQLDSILKQENVVVNIRIRDDGSKDGTLKILEKYSKNYQNISYYQGENLGAAQSFMELIHNNYGDDYYALADQDDIWDKDKLYKGIEFIKRNSKPDKAILYFSNLRFVDADMHFIRNNHDKKPYYNKYSALIETIATGCTFIYNRRLSMILHMYKPEFVSMHDTWVYVVANEFGETVYDITPHINYRQHGDNVVGGNTSTQYRINKIYEYFKQLLGNGEYRPKEWQANELIKGYKQYMSKGTYKRIAKVANYRDSVSNRLGLFFDRRYKSSKWYRDIYNRLFMLFGTL